MRDERGRNHLALFCTKAITAVGSVLGKGRCKMGRCLLGLACVGGRWMCLWGGGVEPPWHLELSSVPGGRRGRSECFSALQPLWNILNSPRVCLVPIIPRKGILRVRYRSIAARISLLARCPETPPLCVVNKPRSPVQRYDSYMLMACVVIFAGRPAVVHYGPRRPRVTH